MAAAAGAGRPTAAVEDPAHLATSTIRTVIDRAEELGRFDSRLSEATDRIRAELAAVEPPAAVQRATRAMDDAVARLHGMDRAKIDHHLKRGRSRPVADGGGMGALASRLERLSNALRSPTGAMSRQRTRSQLMEIGSVYGRLDPLVRDDMRRRHDDIRTRGESETAAIIGQIEDAQGRFAEWIRSTEPMLRGAAASLDAAHPPWTASWTDYTPTESIPTHVRVGSYDVRIDDRRAVGLPALWRFPGGRSLLVETRNMSADLAAAVLSVVFRTIATMPKGSIEVTFADPAGLGGNVAPIMHLRDYDEALVRAKVLSDDADIEGRLVELTNDITTVNSTLLRGKFKTIEEHNAAAGEVAAAYQLLVVMGYPSRFSPKAIDRLADLVETGPAAGVYAVIVLDAAIELPYGATHERIRAACDRVGAGSEPRLNDRWRRAADAPVLQFRGVPAGFVFDAPLDMTVGDRPEATTFGMLCDRIGAAARESRVRTVEFDDLLGRFRSEVERNPARFPTTPLSPILSDGRTWWNASSHHGLDVPIGRIGATNVQRLTIGGNLNHVLIAGANGTGKSTLLHALIGALTVTYGPDELRLSMIDMKNGVGFKTYGTSTALPHADHIAVMCDRSIAIEVLETLVKEMTDRYDRFKRLNESTHRAIESIADYREATGESLPRYVCIIDEYQDLLSGDDAFADTASQLVRLLVKEARAAGIHLILATQNVMNSGLRADSKSEIPIRICFRLEDDAASEAALGDGNYGARKDIPTSEKGVAIYNVDRTTNTLFKGAWIDRSTELPGLVSELHTMAVSRGTDIRTRVFDGDSPGEIRDDADLLRLLGLDPSVFRTLGPASRPTDGRAGAVDRPAVRSSMGRRATPATPDAVVPPATPRAVRSSMGRRGKPAAEGPSSTDTPGIAPPPTADPVGGHVVRSSMGRRSAGAATPEEILGGVPSSPSAPGTTPAALPSLPGEDGFGPVEHGSDGSFVVEMDVPAPETGTEVPPVDPVAVYSGGAHDSGADGASAVDVWDSAGASTEPGTHSAEDTAPPREVERVARQPAAGTVVGRTTPLFLGRPMKLVSSLFAACPRATARNLLVVGGTDSQVIGMLTGAMLGTVGVARHRPPGDLRPVVTIADLEPSREMSSELDRLASVSGGLVAVVRGIEIDRLVADLESEVGAREAQRGVLDPLAHLFCIVGLGNASVLRSSYESAVATAFRSIVQRGPSVGVHTAAFADNWRAATRIVDHDMLGEFGLRVALALPAADTEDALLVRSVSVPGPTRALYRDDRGQIHPFLPYAPLTDPADLFTRIR